jgi:hypothetical protein
VEGTILFLILAAVGTGAIFGGLAFGWRGAMIGASVMTAVTMGAAAPLF